jgi:hypothetical protein
MDENHFISSLFTLRPVQNSGIRCRFFFNFSDGYGDIRAHRAA